MGGLAQTESEMTSREAPGEPLSLIRKALKFWHSDGSVVWSPKPQVSDWMKQHLDRKLYTNQRIAWLMYDHLQRGGSVKEQDNHPEDEFDTSTFYYMILPLHNRDTYIEFVISDDDPDCPCITVVSIHYPLK